MPGEARAREGMGTHSGFPSTIDNSRYSFLKRSIWNSLDWPGVAVDGAGV